MKHLLCSAFALLLVMHCVQATEVPFVELKGHTGYLRSIQFSHEGKRIITIGDSETRVWDAETGKELFTFPGGQLEFPPNEKRIITQSDSETHIWDAESGKKMFTLPVRKNDSSRLLSFSLDEKKIMTRQDSNGPYHVWDAESGKELFTMTSHSDRWSGFSPTFTLDSKKIRMVDGVGGITGQDSKIRFFDAETGKELDLPGRYHGFSPDGKKIFSWGDGEVRIWDDETGKELFTLEGMFYSGFSPDGKRIFTWSDKETYIWDADSGKKLHILTGVYVKFSPNGKKIVTRGYDVNNETDDETIRTYDAETYEKLYTLKGRYVNFTRDGKTIVTSAKDKITRIWDEESGKEFTLMGSYYGSLLDGKKIVTSDNGIRVWNLETGKELWSWASSEESFHNFSPSGKTVVTFVQGDVSDPSNTYRLWDVDSGREIATGRNIHSSNDGKRIVLQTDSEVHFWNEESPKGLFTLPGHSGYFAPGNKKMVTVMNWETRIWDTESGKELHVFPGVSRGFTPDGRLMTIMREENTIRIWDLSAITE